ncbi:metallopeptidase TldD-related protein [Nocardioides sp. R-C-SC26]|uniref:metallopeptidase TldD-related protein n=1 Tax=Nocardioides sp. R-C-SC26 TaxID=2870414 RepID=UPI001E4FED13|nr:metallopeptidase TldD-related protein [Nocardioides sp. R-C-SC26]
MSSPVTAVTTEVAPSPQELAERGLAASRSSDCIVLVHVRSAANLRWADNTLTTNGVSRGCDVTVIAVVRTADGVATASVSGVATTIADVTALVGRADEAASASTAAVDAHPLLAPEDVRDNGATWDQAPATTDISVYGSIAPALGDVFSRARGAGRRLYGFVNHEMVTTYLASSTGVRLRHAQPTGHLGCTGKTADLGASAWVGQPTRDFADIDPHAVDDELTRRLVWSDRRIDLAAGRYDTVLPPTAVADLMIYAYWEASARAAMDGQSVYSAPGVGPRWDERIASPGVQLGSDPSGAGFPGLSCQPFLTVASSGGDVSVFDNGTPLDATAWIEDGHLRALHQSRHTAGQSHRPLTPAIDNLVLDVDGGAGSVEDLVGGTDRGLLLTCLWYIRTVDPQSLLLTGLTRDGVYLIEGGEIVGAVNNFRWNESPLDLLRRFSHAGEAAPCLSREWGDDYFSRTVMPALRVPDFNMSSVSQAT